ncbi:hypothetical protein KC19_7G113500 [Ceratodon purpureus]|uniref:Uncharacterized protein n=1 Tax=Ceratodon purpureus TaxID=3225 RepID=A0A8T0H8W3_CERPU|nr:hypothetical protein KC19_7G113500 [Ceratodon purpureus]
MKWLQIARYSFLSLAFCIDTLPPTVQRLPFNQPGRSGIIRKNALGDLHRSDLCNTVCQKSASTHLKPHHIPYILQAAEFPESVAPLHRHATIHMNSAVCHHSPDCDLSVCLSVSSAPAEIVLLCEDQLRFCDDERMNCRNPMQCENGVARMRCRA